MPTDQKIVEIDRAQRLESWKEIAAYLNCGERTAKRWEKSRSLPVHRLPGGQGQVFAYPAEVSSWRANNSPDLHFPNSDSRLLPLSLAAEQPSSAPANAFSPIPPEPALRRSFVLRYAGLVVFVLLAAGLIMGRRLVHHDKVARLASTPAPVKYVPTSSAQDLYLTGRFYLNKRTPADLQAAMLDFQAAARSDNNYAEAHAGIAETYGFSTKFASMAPQQAYPQMIDEAARAIALDPSLAEGYRALAFALFYWDWDLNASCKEFERSIALDPNNATTFQWYANVLEQGGNFRKALQMMDRARELDPTSRSILADRGLISLRLGQLPVAIRSWTDLEHSDPNYLPPHWYMATTELSQGEAEPALGELRAIDNITHAPADDVRLARCEQGYRKDGLRGLLNADAEFRVEQARLLGTGNFEAALALDAASREQEALHYLELAEQHRDPELPLLAHTDSFKGLRGNPRFEALKSLSQSPYTPGAIASNATHSGSISRKPHDGSPPWD